MLSVATYYNLNLFLPSSVHVTWRLRCTMQEVNVLTAERRGNSFNLGRLFQLNVKGKTMAMKDRRL